MFLRAAESAEENVLGNTTKKKNQTELMVIVQHAIARTHTSLHLKTEKKKPQTELMGLIRLCI